MRIQDFFVPLSTVEKFVLFCKYAENNSSQYVYRFVNVLVGMRHYTYMATRPIISQLLCHKIRGSAFMNSIKLVDRGILRLLHY